MRVLHLSQGWLNTLFSYSLLTMIKEKSRFLVRTQFLLLPSTFHLEYEFSSISWMTMWNNPQEILISHQEILRILWNKLILYKNVTFEEFLWNQKHIHTDIFHLEEEPKEDANCLILRTKAQRNYYSAKKQINLNY